MRIFHFVGTYIDDVIGYWFESALGVLVGVFHYRCQSNNPAGLNIGGSCLGRGGLKSHRPLVTRPQPAQRGKETKVPKTITV